MDGQLVGDLVWPERIEPPTLKKVADKLEDKKEVRVYKQDWKLKEQLELEIGASNVIYLLVDTKHKLLYAGQAKDLIARLSQGHPSIPHWDFFRYDVLPCELE